MTRRKILELPQTAERPTQTPGAAARGSGGLADALARATITPNSSEPPAGTGVVVHPEILGGRAAP